MTSFVTQLIQKFHSNGEGEYLCNRNLFEHFVDYADVLFTSIQYYRLFCVDSGQIIPK